MAVTNITKDSTANKTVSGTNKTTSSSKKTTKTTSGTTSSAKSKTYTGAIGAVGGVSVRQHAYAGATSIGTIPYQGRVTVTKQYNGYYYIKEYKGWVKISSVVFDSLSVKSTDIPTEKEVLTKAEEKEKEQIKSAKEETAKEKEKQAKKEAAAEEDADSAVIKVSGTTTISTAEVLQTDNMMGIFGMPYQFMSSVDRRLDDTVFGRKYAEKIVARMPLLFLRPGRQSFMSEFSTADRKSVLTTAVDMVQGVDSVNVNDLLEDGGKYYTLKDAWTEYYYSYVNPMCWTVAHLMDVDSKKVTMGSYTSTLRTFDWSSYSAQSGLLTYFKALKNVVFYLDASPTISESFSNDTKTSALIDTVNSASSTVKEIQFIMGNKITDTANSIANSSLVSTVKSSISSVINSFSSGNGVLNSIIDGGLTSVISGGKLLFPELWSDSERSTSYNLNIKLRSPDRDDLSIYLNIIVPYIHLISLVCAQQSDLENAAYSYVSPFLVGATYQGTFNIDMGMITDLSVTKAAEGAYNNSGIPTQMDISLTIKDLYDNFYLTDADSTTGILDTAKINRFVRNTSLMDYLCNMAGMNLAQPDIVKQAVVKYMLGGSNLVNLPNKAWRNIQYKVDQQLIKIFNKLS